MYKKIIPVFIICITIFLTACSSGEGGLTNVEKPEGLSTSDEVHPTQSPDAVEESENINGAHYTATLQEFTGRYNSIMMDTGGTDYLYRANWKKQGAVQEDNNGVEYQLYYYNEELFTITAAVEIESGKIMNVGCGTTMNTFVTQENDVNNSDTILHACAIEAAAVCGFNENSLDVLQDIFYRTTFENVDSLYYEGNVFCMDTNDDNENSENNTMLFRIFPISEALKTEWQITDYETYIATLPTD